MNCPYSFPESIITMETKEHIKETLKRFKPVLREKYKVKQIGLFGSYVRGEESEESDIDILVEFSEPIGWEFVDLVEFLEKILSRKVDLVTIRALKPRLKEKILKEVVYA
jgi:predicted nucleotidyltransferase